METSSDRLIAATLDGFGERLKRLEDAEQKTGLGRLQKRASFLALMIGILLSLVSLYDVFWSKPRDALVRDMEEFNKAVNAVANLRQNMVQVRHQSNPQLFFEMNAMVTPQILANIQYANALLPRLGDRAGIPQLIVLISEAMNIYDWPSATALVDRAVKSKNAIPSLQSEAWRYQGRLLFMTGRTAEAREAFTRSLSVLRDERAFGINGARAYIAADWALVEFALGECSVGLEAARQFVKYVQDPQIPAPSRAGLVDTWKAQLQQTGKRCPIPPEITAL